MDNDVPEWIKTLSEEDLQFLKRFLLASGSLKSLAQEYGITYPTIRLRLDRLIEKVKTAENTKLKNPFEKALQILLVEGVIDTTTARQLMKAHKKTVQMKESEGKNDES